MLRNYSPNCVARLSVLSTYQVSFPLLNQALKWIRQIAHHGGKDSFTMLDLLLSLQQKALINFGVLKVNLF